MSSTAPSRVRFSGAVLTGGRSRRMGSDKAFAELAGRPMVSYPIAALTAAGADEVLAVGGDGERLAALGCVAVTESEPGRGPLAGIVAALEAASHQLVAVVGCDLPLISAATVARLLAAAGRGPGAVATVDGRLQPVLAVYDRRLAPVLASALADDGAAHRAITGRGLVTVAMDGKPDCLNVNEPDDLLVAEDLLRRRSTWPADGGR